MPAPAAIRTIYCNPDLVSGDDDGTSEANAWQSVADAVDDFNGDGFADLIVSDAQISVGGLGSGAFEIFLGGPDGLDPEPNQIFTGRETGGLYGKAFALGDFDDDGVDDLAVGAPGERLSGVGEGGDSLRRGLDRHARAPGAGRDPAGLRSIGGGRGRSMDRTHMGPFGDWARAARELAIGRANRFGRVPIDRSEPGRNSLAGADLAVGWSVARGAAPTPRNEGNTL